MIVCLIIGPEGTGHHACRAMFSPFLKSPQCRIAIKVGESRVRDVWLKNIPLDKFAVKAQQRLKALADEGVTHVWEDTSFPFLWNRLVPTYPDVNQLLQIFDGFDLRVLLLRRDPVESTASIFRRSRGGKAKTDIYNEGAITSRTISHLHESVYQMGIDYRFVDFHSMLKDPVKAAERLAAHFSIPVELAAPQNIYHNPTGCRSLEDSQIKLLQDIFRIKAGLLADLYPDGKKLL